MRVSPIPFLLAVAVAGTLRAQNREEFENPPISYSATAPDDAAKKIEARLASGALKLAGSDREIVAALLREFGVTASSQVVVFSKTSFQRGRINPDHPRAIYFSDNCYIGWVPGGLVEVTTIDPTLGPIFYTFDPHAREGAALRARRRLPALPRWRVRARGASGVRALGLSRSTR